MDCIKAWSRRAPHVLLALLLAFPVTEAFASQANEAVSPQVQQLYAEARTAQQHGDTATAIQKYRAMLKLAPRLAPAYNNLGMIYFNQQDYTHAAEVLKRGLEVNPNMPTAEAMLGMCYFQLGMNEKAEPLLRAALKANPADDRAELMLVHILINLKRFEDATVELNKLVERNPKSQEGWYLLGKTYLQLSENALAKINQIDPNSVVAHEIAGEIDESMHNYDSAMAEYKKVIEMAPNEPGTHMHMANAYWLVGKWKSAQEEFKAVLQNDPNSCIAHWKLADAILEANDSNDEALSEVNLAIGRCPTLMQARVDRARALIRMGKQIDALPDLEAAVKESPSEPTIHFLLASVYRTQGKTVEARQEMQTYSRLQREATEAIAGQAKDASDIKNTAH
jgi:tetratricopeptide (TPR) repeat protein